MESALLWYGLYPQTLKSRGFAVNPYDMWIEKSTIRGNQCTIAWYVDENKVSYIDEEVNIKLIETIAKRFGELTVSIGKKYKFLVIGIEFLSDGKISLFMKD